MLIKQSNYNFVLWFQILRDCIVQALEFPKIKSGTC